jgi:adenylate cyclase
MDRRNDGSGPVLTAGSGLSLTLNNVNHPAHLVNSMFELEWSNEQADIDLLDLDGHLSANLTERNIFSILLDGSIIPYAQDRYELIRFHLAIAKNRMSKKALLTIDPDMELDDIETLAKIYDEAEAVPAGQVAQTVVNLAPHGEEAKCYAIITSFFCEGIFFSFLPVEESTDSILSFLGRRDIVIRDLLKNRKPYLTPLAVIVADIQDSVKYVPNCRLKNILSSSMMSGARWSLKFGNTTPPMASTLAMAWSIIFFHSLIAATS